MNSTGGAGYKMIGESNATSWAAISGRWNAQGSPIFLPYVYGTAINQYALLDDASVKQILTPSATGVTIVSEPNGTIQNWTGKSSSFNYADPNGYTYKIIY